MTVRQLIRQLKLHPGHLKVLTEDGKEIEDAVRMSLGGEVRILNIGGDRLGAIVKRTWPEFWALDPTYDDLYLYDNYFYDDHSVRFIAPSG